MPNTEDNFDKPEEYKLTEEGEGGYEGEGEPLIPGPMADIASKFKSKYKRILVPIGLIVIIYVVYQFLSWYSARNAREETKQQVVAEQQAVTPPPAVTAPAVSVVQPTGNDVIQKKLEVLTQGIESNREQLANLNDGLAKNQQVLASLDSAISTISASLDNIGKQVQQLIDAQKPKKKAKKAAPRKIYHIKAIVPGRAWLEDNEGQTTTIKVGDSLYGYGKVTLISPKDGVIIMSSGDVIQYGINDY